MMTHECSTGLWVTVSVSESMPNRIILVVDGEPHAITANDAAIVARYLQRAATLALRCDGTYRCPNHTGGASSDKPCGE